MKKIYAIISGAIAAMLLAVSCQKTDAPTPGPAENVLGETTVYFPEQETEWELPVGTAEFQITASRNNTEGTLSVPITVVWNENDAYTVPGSFEFADGEETAEITVTQKGQVAVAYNLEIRLPDKYHYFYKENEEEFSYKCTSTQISWSDVCTGTYTPSAESGMNPFATTLQVCDQDNTKYRFKYFINQDFTTIVFQTKGKAQQDEDGTYYNFQFINGGVYPLPNGLLYMDITSAYADDGMNIYNCIYTDGYIVFPAYYAGSGMDDAYYDEFVPTE